MIVLITIIISCIRKPLFGGDGVGGKGEERWGIKKLPKNGSCQDVAASPEIHPVWDRLIWQDPPAARQ